MLTPLRRQPIHPLLPHLSPQHSTLSPPPPPPPPLDAKLAGIILTTETLTKTLLQDPSIPWSETLVNLTLKRLWNHGPKALHFFQTLSHHPTYTHSLSSFDIAIDIAARLRRYNLLWSLLGRLPGRPSPRTFAIIIERYVSAGKPDRAVKIFLSMHNHGCPQDLICFNVLLDVLCKSKRVEKAYELFRVLKGRFGVDIVSYNIIANGFCLIKRINKALEVLKEMILKGLSPNLTTYNIILKGYFRAGLINEGWEFFMEMKRRDVEIDVVTYTTLVHGFGVVGEVKRSKRVFDLMVEEGVLPNVATYNALIQVLCKKDSVENAISVFEEMVRKGYVPNLTTYNLLVRGLCHIGAMDRAMEFVGRMEGDRCEPGVQTYNLLIRYYCDLGEIEKGLDLFDRMNGGKCLPNLDTYNILISSMFVRKKSEDLVGAGKLLIEMVDRGFLPRKFTFNRVLNGLLLTGNQEFAKEILRLQSQCGRLPRHFRL